MMDLFSLEEDECNEMFITQSSKDNCVRNDGNLSPILGDGFDFGAPLVSLCHQVNGNNSEPVYEDISDDDFMPQSLQRKQVIDGYVIFSMYSFIVKLILVGIAECWFRF